MRQLGYDKMHDFRIDRCENKCEIEDRQDERWWSKKMWWWDNGIGRYSDEHHTSGNYQLKTMMRVQIFQDNIIIL